MIKPKITGDGNLVHSALMCIGRLVKQIHPTHKGKIDISIRTFEDSIEVFFSIERGENLQVENNPELFIAQSIADMHNGKLKIEYRSDGGLDMKFTIALQTRVSNDS